jgi:hypothetical protein
VFVAVGTPVDAIYAYDLATGTALWNKSAGAQAWLAYDQGDLFSLDASGNLTAWDVATQVRLWSVKLTTQSLFESPPVATGGLVYVNGLGEGGTTFAVNEADGGLVWSMNTEDGSDGTVAVAGAVVYESEAVQQTSAFNAATGTLNWNYNGMPGFTGGGGAAPAVYQGDIYVRDSAGNYVLDSAGQATGTFTSTLLPAFNAGTAFYSTDSFSGNSGVAQAVNLTTGSIDWTFDADPGLCTAAVVAGDGGQVFVGSNLGGVYELDEASGAVRSTVDAGSPVTCGDETHSMAIAGGHLLVPAGNSLFVY